MTPTQPTAEQLRLARGYAAKAYRNADPTDALAGYIEIGEVDDDEAVQSALLAIQATEARMAVEGERARCSKLAADYAASMTPTIRLGDEDSIYLTDHEQGQKDAAKRLSIMIYETAIRSQPNE